MRIPALLLIASLSFPAQAGETAWQELAPGTRARLISSDVAKADGTTMIGLELDMPLSTNTYWRVPGETGIPTVLDFAGSTGVSGHEMLWPYPRVETTTGYVDYVYRGPLVMPVTLRLDGQPAELRVAVTMGICDEVCVPVMASFELPLSFAAPDRAQGLRIAQAVAQAPVDWTGPGDPVASVVYDRTADALAVALGSPDIDPLSLIADAGEAGQLFGAPQKSPDGKLVLLPLLGGDQGRNVEGSPVRLTFMTEMGPFSVERRVSSAGSSASGD
jgi:DsbC/DsbD-like thiol-disulfide interchange protein